MSQPIFPYILLAFLVYATTIAGVPLSLSDRSTESEAGTDLNPRQISGHVGSAVFLRRAWQASAVAGHFLYIDGGELSYRPADPEKTIYGYSSSTLSIDLSQDWVNDTVVFHSSDKPTRAPSLSSSDLWYDETNNLFYAGFNGRVSFFGDEPEPRPLSLWSFKLDAFGGGGTWSEVIPADDPIWDNLTRTYRGSIASGARTALVLSGAENFQTSRRTRNATKEIPVPGLVKFDFATQKFTNSTSGLAAATGPVAGGQMNYVPSFGPGGLFLAMGGANQTNNENLAFDKVWIYDEISDSWYNQTTSGDQPIPRRDFCTAGVNSTDGTYEIFLYGGYDGNVGSKAIPFDEIYILSLPAFQWFKVDYPPERPRNGHSCNSVGGSQIVTVGGADGNAEVNAGFVDGKKRSLMALGPTPDDVHKSAFNSTPDPFAQGLGIFDMTTLKWADHYTANAPAYTQSDTVRNFYAENPQNAPITASELSSTPDDTSSSSSSSPTNTGAITGGAVGGAAAVAIVAGVLFVLLRRRRQRRQDTANDSGKELRGSTASLPEADGFYATETAQELSNEHKMPAEVEGARPEMANNEVRHELGNDEVNGHSVPPMEMDAAESRKR
ncbi:MAG: hypothetical protein Q9174_002715 [Haloplaca sp. 1 TL-2023]